VFTLPVFFEPALHGVQESKLTPVIDRSAERVLRYPGRALGEISDTADAISISKRPAFVIGEMLYVNGPERSQLTLRSK
jgi:hypothetical protein